MKYLLAYLFLFLVLSGCHPTQNYRPQNGDIIFQTSQSAQSTVIQKVTKSKYSHMGIVYIQENQPFVYEAIGPVKLTPLSAWAARGVGGHYVVKRLKDAENKLTHESLNRMRKAGEAFAGKPYDLTFEWSDDRIYCSELVWKIYKRSLDIEVGQLQKMKDFDLSDPAVQAMVRTRFGNHIPAEETVISPAAIFASDRLVTVNEK